MPSFMLQASAEGRRALVGIVSNLSRFDIELGAGSIKDVSRISIESHKYRSSHSCRNDFSPWDEVENLDREIWNRPQVVHFSVDGAVQGIHIWSPRCFISSICSEFNHEKRFLRFECSRLIPRAVFVYIVHLGLGESHGFTRTSACVKGQKFASHFSHVTRTKEINESAKLSKEGNKASQKYRTRVCYLLDVGMHRSRNRFCFAFHIDVWSTLYGGRPIMKNKNKRDWELNSREIDMVWDRCRIFTRQRIDVREPKIFDIASHDALYLSQTISEPDRKELELELIQTQMAQKPMLRAEVGMRVRCANKASAEWFRRERGIGQIPRKICRKRGICGCCALRRTIKRKAREQRSSW